MADYRQAADRGDIPALMNMTIEDPSNVARIGIRNNNVDLVRWAMDRVEYDRDTLHNFGLLASQNGSTQVLDLLMDINDNLGYDFMDWAELAQAAARIGDIETVKAIVLRANRDDGEFNQRFYWRKTARIAHLHNNRDILDWLINRM